MFCPNCGNSQAEGSVFCPKCGSKVQPDQNQQTPGQAPFATMEQPKPKKKVLIPIIAGAAAVVLGLAGFLFYSSLPSITEDNAETLLISTSDVPLNAVDGEKPSFEGEILDECKFKGELSGLFQTGDTWATAGIQSEEGEEDAFHVHQRVFKVEDVEDLSRTAELLDEVATDGSCDSDSPGSYISYSFDYQNSQTIEEAYGVDLEGRVLDIDFFYCLDDSCFSSYSKLLIAFRGDVGMLVKYSSGDNTSINRDIEDALVEKLNTFAG
jgi:hypothetical protein